MIKFLIYLFESGICMIFLYLAYWFFLRKETYFYFNRLFLVGSIFLVLFIPLLHVNLSISRNETFGGPAARLMQVRSYYEQLIAMTDPDWLNNNYRSNADMNDFFEGKTPGGGSIGDVKSLSDLSREEELAGINGKQRGLFRGISPAEIILLVYLGGVIYFFFRFLYLVIRLIILSKRYGIIRQDGLKMVNMKEELSPFSFFGYVFINLEVLSEAELRNILAHEKTHVRQRHTIDHLLAQGVAVFQWFNPFAWQIRNALKTTHEYIADRKVLDQGFGIFDYQSLLLKQVITYHSVELVNNFNLKPIKKRIAMMTKLKSGIPAKLKALLVIPFALLLFLFFADFTISGTDNSFLKIIPRMKEKQDQEKFIGLWKNNDEGAYGQLIFFNSEKMYILEEQSGCREYYYSISENLLTLSFNPERSVNMVMKYKLTDSELTVYWSNIEFSVYQKTPFKNSMELLLANKDMKIDLPVILRYRLMEDQSRVYDIFLGYPDESKTGDPELIFLKTGIDFEQFPEMLEKEKKNYKAIDHPFLTAVLHIDKDMPMKYVYKLKQLMRENNSLKFADAGIPYDGEVLPVLRHTVGLPRLLPPMDAKIIEKEEIRKRGIGIFEIDLAARNITPAALDRDLKKFIQENNKFVMILKYDNETPYGEYMETVDMIFDAVYDLREELALSKYNIPYNDLGPVQQKEIKEVYPMTLTEENVDEDF